MTQHLKKPPFFRQVLAKLDFSCKIESLDAQASLAPSRRHCGGRHGGRQGGRHGGQQKKKKKKVADMELDMVAKKDVDKVADMVTIELPSNCNNRS